MSIMTTKQHFAQRERYTLVICTKDNVFWKTIKYQQKNSMSQVSVISLQSSLEMSSVQLVLLNNLVYDAGVSAAPPSCPRGRRVTIVDAPPPPRAPKTGEGSRRLVWGANLNLSNNRAHSWFFIALPFVCRDI